jgi:hypothetical protein
MSRKTRVQSDLLSGGISRQPPQARSRAQVQLASNAHTSLKRGLSSRAGTRMVAVVAGLSESVTYDWQYATLASTGQVRVLTGSDGTVRVVNANGTLAPVTIHTGSAAYMATGSPTAQIMAVLEDRALLAVPAVVPVAGQARPVEVLGEADDLDALTRFSPITNSAAREGVVYRAKNPTTTSPAGLYRYAPGGGRYAVVTCANYVFGNSVAPLNQITMDSRNPIGARIQFLRRILGPVTATWDGTSVMTLPSALPTDYTWQVGDRLVLSGTGAGAYTITRARNNGGVAEFQLAQSPGAAGAFTVEGVGIEAAIVCDFSREVPGDIEDVAAQITRQLQLAGLPHAVASFDAVGLASAYTYRLKITADTGGELAGFSSVPIRAHGGSGIYDGLITIFNTTGLTITSGAGTIFRTPPRSRWVSIADPTHSKGVPDDMTLPQSLTALPTAYWDALVAMRPIAAWRLSELAVINLCTDSTGVYHATRPDGSWATVAAPAGFGAGALGVQINTTQKISTPALRDSAHQCRQGMTFVGHFQSVSTSSQHLVHLPGLLQVTLNANAAGASTNSIRVRIGPAGEAWDVASSINLNTGAWRRITVALTTGVGLNVWVDDTLMSKTYAADSGGPVSPTFAGLTDATAGNLGSATGSGGMGTGSAITGYALLPFALDQASVTDQMLRANGTVSTRAYFVGPTPWTPALTGNETSNPAGKLLTDGKGVTALAVWASRLVIAAGQTFTMTSARNKLSLYAEDATAITGADPIESLIGSDRAVRIIDMLPIEQALLLRTDGPTQYTARYSGELTAGTLRVNPNPEGGALAGRAVRMGDRAFYAAPAGVYAELVQYRLDADRVYGFSDRVAQHVEGLLPLTDYWTVSAADASVVVLVPKGGSAWYTYHQAVIGEETRMSAWTSSTTDGVVRAATGNGSTLALLVQRGTGVSAWFAIEELDCTAPIAETGWAYSPRLDARTTLSGVHSAGTTTWTLPAGATATGYTRAVKPDGTVLTVTPGAGVVTAAGDHSATTCQIGRPFTFEGQLSEPFLFDQYGTAQVNWQLHVTSVHWVFSVGTTIGLYFQQPGRARRTVPVTWAGLDQQRYTLHAGGPVEGLQIGCTSTDPRPVCVASYAMELDAVANRT